MSKWYLEITVSLNCNQVSKGLGDSAVSNHVKCVVYMMTIKKNTQAKQIETVVFDLR